MHFIKREALDKGAKTELWLQITKRALKESHIRIWETDGDVKWGFDGKEGRLIVKGEGPLDNYADGSKTCQMKEYEENSPWTKKHKKQIQSVIIYHGVSSISKNAFSDSLLLASITIRLSHFHWKSCILKLLFIFGQTSRLNHFHGERAFYNCSAVELVIIPDSVTSIENSAFSGYYALASITFFGSHHRGL